MNKGDYVEDNYADVDMQTKEKPEYKLGHKIGTLFAYVIYGCGVAIVVALTIKFITWLFL